MPTVEYADHVTCPHCGYENPDGYELFERWQECTTATCNSCEKEFQVTQHISIRYSSFPMPPEVPK